MRLNQLRFIFLIIMCVGVLSSFNAMAISYNREIRWWGGDVHNQVAANCDVNIPTLEPFSAPRVLIADNHLPNGTVLYSWSYADFAPNITAFCNPVGAPVPAPVASAHNYSNIVYFSPAAWIQTGFIPAGTKGYMATNNSGVGVVYYLTYSQKGSCNNCRDPKTTRQGDSTIKEPPLNQEYPLGSRYFYIAGFWEVEDNFSPYYRYFSSSAHNTVMSIRAELIKVGDIDYNTPLAPAGAPYLSQHSYTSGNDNFYLNNMLGSGGITFIPPSCRLYTPTDYVIDLGLWVRGGSGTLSPDMTLPAYGVIKPVNLRLECSGKTDNVQFKFEDTSSSPLSNHNIRLYDSNSGSEIDGLEIEMSYGGHRVDVDNITKTSVGSKGEIKTNTEDFSFNSQDTATFGARFVQTGPIKKSGANYTGPVTGKVNIYVIYN